MAASTIIHIWRTNLPSCGLNSLLRRVVIKERARDSRPDAKEPQSADVSKETSTSAEEAVRIAMQ